MKRLLVVVAVLHVGHALANVQEYETKISDLEERVARLEKTIQEIEPAIEQRYGLIRRCEKPVIENGFAECEQDLQFKPGTKCRLVCDSGYIATPDLDVTECKTGGVWSVQMKCEIPLVIVGGGLINEDTSDTTMEVIDFEDRPACNFDLPDLPLRNGSGWSLHNLMYDKDKSELLACNGITPDSVATCDKLKMSMDKESWEFHSYPNKGSVYQEAMDRLYSMEGSYIKRSAYNPFKNYGRYAAEAHTIDGKPFILGGMVYNNTHHVVTNSIRSFDGENWSKLNLGRGEKLMNRAFFCSVKFLEAGVINLGGYNDKKVVVNNVTVRHIARKRDFVLPRNVKGLPGMPTPLSGHGCTLLPDSYDIMVAGGSRDQQDNSQWSAYIYSWNNNTWNRTENMNKARFGHKLVAVGNKVYAIGGKERNKDVFLDSLEAFHPNNKSWVNLDRKLTKPRAHFGLALVPRTGFPGCK